MSGDTAASVRGGGNGGGDGSPTVNTDDGAGGSGLSAGGEKFTDWLDCGPPVGSGLDDAYGGRGVPTLPPPPPGGAGDSCIGS